MPIYVVGARAQRVRIPNQALSITVTGSVTGAALDIRAGAQTVVRSSDHHAVLPQIDAPLVVALIPRGAARFAPGTVVHLAIAHDTPTVADPVQVVFDPVDISGEAVVVFAELTPQGPDIEVAASALADTPMNPLAAAARSVARATVGRGRPARATPVVLACDTSASMRQWFADGSVAAAADIVVGVADALGLGAAAHQHHLAGQPAPRVGSPQAKAELYVAAGRHQPARRARRAPHQPVAGRAWLSRFRRGCRTSGARGKNPSPTKRFADRRLPHRCTLLHRTTATQRSRAAGQRRSGIHPSGPRLQSALAWRAWSRWCQSGRLRLGRAGRFPGGWQSC